jgi:hypothetical protein
MLFKKKRSLLNNYGGSQSPTPSFVNLLTNTLVPTVSLGSSTPTFTRATTAYVQDWEGLYKPVLSGEARFTGARRVRNLVGKSQNIADGLNNWTASSATLSASGIDDPNGGTVAQTLTASATNGQLFCACTVPSGATGVTSLWIRRRTGTGQIFFKRFDGSTVENITITSSWKRYSCTAIATSGTTGYLAINLASSGDAIDICFPMAEDVTGQSNQNPSEYVSVGVLSAPYHGAGVDGVKYFTTLNGNTVASNVVTEATGAKITSAASGASSATTDTYGPFGYLAEGSRTNLVRESQTLGSATWAKANTTVTADAAAAPDGTMTADLLYPTTTGVLRYASVAVAVSAATATWSVYVKPAGLSWIYVLLNDGSAGIGWFNATTGAAGTTAGGFSTKITALQNGWYKYSITGTATLNGSFYIGVSDADNSLTATTSGTNGVYLWGMGLEQASFASSYIPTTTVAVTRNADNLNYVSSGNITAVQGTLYAEAILNTSTPYNTGMIVALANATTGLRMSASNTVNTTTFSDGTIATEKTGLTNISTAPRARAATWVTGGLVSVYGDGNQTPATNNYTAPTITGIGIGNDTGGTSNWFGNIRNVRIYSQALTAAQVARIPTL